MTKSSILIDLDDPRTARIADAISNKTSKRILASLAEQELSETELSKNLVLPANTINYNIKRLEESGLIEKTSGYFWSVKGKRIHRYKVSNKKIVISPKSMIKGVLPAIIISGLITIGIKMFVGVQSQIEQKALDAPSIAEKTAEYAGAAGSSGISASEKVITETISQPIQTAIASSNSWAWFLFGALMALLILVLWNSFSINLKGGKNGK